MKKTYFIGVIFLLTVPFFNGSCKKDFLDQKPTSALTEADYFNNIGELETGLVTCYAALGGLFNFECDLWGLGDIGSDDADKGSTADDQYDLTDVSYSRQTATNFWTPGLWFDCYPIISRCNKVIEKSTGLPKNTDTIAIRIIVNQAKFIRALCYYHLVTAYGDVPLVNKYLDPDQLNLKRAPVAEVWSQVESDLIAATKLPSKNEWKESGRVTSGAAWSMLGKVYITEGKFVQANHAFYQVVNSHQYELVNDFSFIFRHEGENCDESIFEIQHKNNIENGSLCSWTAAFRMPRDNGAGGWGFDTPTQDLFNEFEPGDPRIIYTFMFKGDIFPIDENNNYIVENGYSLTGFNCRKAWIPWSERSGINADFNNWEINWRYMRYAEVLLLYAESLNEVMKPDSALYLLNKVRERARITPTTDIQRISCSFQLPTPNPLLPDVTTTNQSDLRNAIWHEQRVELATEGLRRNYLLRTGRFIERMNSAKQYAGVIDVQPYQLLFPIPLQDINASNGLITQNPGY
jgi:hypothetical protein